jgi:hypothetical protein
MNTRQLGQALSERWKSMRRKLPIIVCAALACYGLYYLDQVKRRFDEEKAKPILIDDTVKNRVGKKFKENGGTEDEWAAVEKFIAKQHTTPGNFVNNVAARISQEAEVTQFAAEARFKDCLSKALASSSSVEDTTATVERDACATAYLKRNEDAYREAQSKIANAYRYIKQRDLDEIKKNLEAEEFQRTGEPKPAGYVASALQPTLDDQSGLHIIYQTFRISLLVLIVFAFISFVVLLLSALMLSDGIKTFTEHATSFIGSGKPPTPLLTKGTILSIAALGLGTAVVAGGAVSSFSGATAVHEPAPLVKSSKPADAATGGKGAPSRPNSSQYDYSDTQYAYDNSNNDYSFLDNHSVTSNYPLPAPVIRVFPEVSVVPTDIGGHGGVADESLTNSIKTHLNNMLVLNQQLLAKLDKLVPVPAKEDIKVSNHVKDNADKPLLIQDASTGPISESISSLKTNLESIKNATTALDLDAVQTTNVDKPIQPKERSLVGRWFRGSDKYFVSKRSVDQLEHVKKGRVSRNDIEKQRLKTEADNDPTKKIAAEKQIAELDSKSEADGLILEAIKLLYLQGGKPTEEAKLFAELKTTLRELLLKSTLTSKRQDDTLDRLQEWRDTILTYTRIN